MFQIRNEIKRSYVYLVITRMEVVALKRKSILIVGSALFIAAGCLANSENKKEHAEFSQSIAKPLQPVSVSLKPESFDKNKAVAAVFKDHPEYPQEGEFKQIETMTGGPAPGTLVKGTLATSVETSSEPDHYIVTLTKQWDFSFNDKKLIGYWKYNVTPQTVHLVDREDNTDLLAIVK